MGQKLLLFYSTSDHAEWLIPIAKKLFDTDGKSGTKPIEWTLFGFTTLRPHLSTGVN